jgi:hypothetical protein
MRWRDLLTLNCEPFSQHRVRCAGTNEPALRSSCGSPISTDEWAKNPNFHGRRQ